MFYKYRELGPSALPPETRARADAVAQALPQAEIRRIERRFVSLYLPDLDEVIEGDVTKTGFTVYLGGFDWVTFPSPPQLLQKFPEFMPLPPQVFNAQDEAL